ncbi:galactitol-1-phosphate 5-dehydrogenase [Psychrobacillus sp. INOP01]|uniref:galactitol-1-phosphate 5-dehydrogenase n=1 Tax=Psychrobacillus sp. INOP01 TaxID=2829187 RepID=UPI001BA97891|nr:galactitol-1-phosphate 5-dehydrogenase [Psychrobacillus sp. INOP01]QUG40681.1 galactitol-1-phosphate 5-dehydrogenase [Psychrobacillus sp. INOP01]
MKAGVLNAREKLIYEDVETPVPGLGDVLIKVKYTGICGSDIPRVNGDAAHSYPIILGHEFSGEVVEVGKNVKSLAVGDRVAGAPLLPCMVCEYCSNGDYALCEAYSFIGSRRSGSFAEYVVVPEKNAIRFDSSISFEQGAFFEPITVALHGIRRLDFQSGRSVAILGIGNIGFFTLQWLKILGAGHVTVFDISEERLELAKRFGADECINSSDPSFLEQLDGRRYDYVLETAGNTTTIKLTFELVKKKGSVCLIGTPTKELAFSVHEWEHLNRKEFFLTGSWMSYSQDFPGEEWIETAKYIRSGDIKIDESLLFKKIPLSEIASAFEMFKTPGMVKGKILIDSEK